MANRVLARCLVAGVTAAGVSAARLTTPSPAAAATLRVTTTTDELAPGDRRCSLREAVFAIQVPGHPTDCGAANATANTIVLRSGHYTLSIRPSGRDDNTTGDLNVISHAPLTIIGAGEKSTVINASSLEDRILSVGKAARVTVRGLTITGGHARDGRPGSPGSMATACNAGGAGGRGHDAGRPGNGGGIANNGTLTLLSVAVIRNTAGAGGDGGRGAGYDVPNGFVGCVGGAGGNGGSGGGIYNQGTLIVVGSTISGDHAGAGGAGGHGGNAANNGSAAASGGAGGGGSTGGGIYNNGAPARLIVTTSTMAQNRGGIGGTGGTGGVNVSGVGFPGNGGNGGTGQASGGAIANRLGTVTVTRSTLVGNAAGFGGLGGGDGIDGFVGGNGGDGSGGGGISSIGGLLRVTNSTLAFNSAGGGGDGGPGNIGGGNGGTAGDGGAIRVTDGTSLIENATIAGNDAGVGGNAGVGGMGNGNNGGNGMGGGLFVQSSSTAHNLRLENTIVASSINGTNCSGPVTDMAGNMSFGDTSCPGGNGDPKLGQLQNNGGPTQTMALSTASAAIDQVPKARCPGIDQRGASRPDTHESKCDIGAYERNP